MKKYILSFIGFLISFLVFTQTPQTFNYQAVARGSDGSVLANNNLSIRINLLSGSATGTLIWQEVHDVITNDYGLFTLEIGSETKTGGSAIDFTSIEWGEDIHFLKIEVDDGGYTELGTIQLLAVPYALNAQTVGELKSLDIVGDQNSPIDSALFEVKRSDGQTVFAVYNDGVQVYVEENPAIKRNKGGFAIGGFDAAKGLTNEFFRVTPDSVRIYIKNPTNKRSKGGFAIGGFDAAKADVTNFLDLTPENYFIGHQAGISNTTGTFNSFIGYLSGYSNTEGSRNVFLGYSAGWKNLDGYENTFIGNNVGINNISGRRNTFIGNNSGANNTAGNFNIFIGSNTGLSNTTGTGNVFIGNRSGQHSDTTSSNVFVGNFTGYSTVAGEENVYIGTRAGQGNISGSKNTFMGYKAGWKNLDGYENTFLGNNSGINNTSGIRNTFIGNNSGENNTEGNNNIFIGSNSGLNNTTGAGNVFIGHEAGKYVNGISNRLIIENENIDSTKALIYGEFDQNHLRINGNVGINYQAYNSYGLIVDVPDGQTSIYTLLIYGNAWASGGTWSSSDVRYKKNVKTFKNALVKLQQLRCVSFDWKIDQYPELRFSDRNQMGFIAQEVEEIFPELVKEDHEGYKAINYGKFTPIIVEAMKEQQQEIEDLQQEIKELNVKLQAILDKLEQ